MIPLQILFPGNFIYGFKLKFDITEIALVGLAIFLTAGGFGKNHYHLLQPALIKTFYCGTFYQCILRSYVTVDPFLNICRCLWYLGTE